MTLGQDHQHELRDAQFERRRFDQSRQRRGGDPPDQSPARRRLEVANERHPSDGEGEERQGIGLDRGRHRDRALMSKHDQEGAAGRGFTVAPGQGHGDDDQAGGDAEERQELRRPHALAPQPHRDGAERRIDLRLGLDVARAIAAPVDARLVRREFFERQVAGDGLGVGLAPALPVVGDGVGAAHGEHHRAPGDDRADGDDAVVHDLAPGLSADIQRCQRDGVAGGGADGSGAVASYALAICSRV